MLLIALNERLTDSTVRLCKMQPWDDLRNAQTVFLCRCESVWVPLSVFELNQSGTHITQKPKNWPLPRVVQIKTAPHLAQGEYNQSGQRGLPNTSRARQTDLGPGEIPVSHHKRVDNGNGDRSRSRSRSWRCSWPCAESLKRDRAKDVNEARDYKRINKKTKTNPAARRETCI